MSKPFSAIIKDNFQLVYSIILLIFIPGIIVLNTYIQINGFHWYKINFNGVRDVMDEEIRLKAQLAETVFGGAAADNLNDEDILQTQIDQILKTSPEIKDITILRPEGSDGYLVLASSDENSLGVMKKSKEFALSWLEEQSIAVLVTDQTVSPPERFWSVVTPLYNTDDKETALIEMKGSVKYIDDLVKQLLNTSLIILSISVFLVLALLVYHFRFVEYAVLYRQLRDVDKMKDDFISIASHEMKTPMAAIKGYLSMIFEGVGGKIDDKARGHLDKAFANVQRLDVLVNELLEVSRLEQGRVQLEMQAIDTSTTIKQIISELKVKADEKKLYIHYQELVEPKPKIFVDADRFAQILDNIVGNAIKYTLKGGIDIYHQIEKNHLKTYIKDTGVGMSADDRKRLFEKFYRIQNEKTYSIAGTGLGLWITKALIEKMNGQIGVDSMENVGSQFVITFPIIKEK